MISAVLLALAGLSAQPVPPSATPAAAYGSDTIAHLKGHHVAPARESKGKVRTSSAGCHPDPHKGRSCRIHAAKVEQRAREAFARAETETTRMREAAP